MKGSDDVGWDDETIISEICCNGIAVLLDITLLNISVSSVILLWEVLWPMTFEIYCHYHDKYMLYMLWYQYCYLWWKIVLLCLGNDIWLSRHRDIELCIVAGSEMYDKWNIRENEEKYQKLYVNMMMSSQYCVIISERGGNGYVNVSAERETSLTCRERNILSKKLMYVKALYPSNIMANIISNSYIEREMAYKYLDIWLNIHLS